METRFDLGKMIAPEFLSVWWVNCPTRYRVMFGARNTGKSYTFLGLEVLHKVLYDKNRNICIFDVISNCPKYTNIPVFVI